VTLEQFFKENPKVALGFSGGVDSTYLLYAGLKYGADVRAYYVNADFQPDFELKDAYALAEQIGTEITVLKLDALVDARVAANPPERCYYCKLGIFGFLQTRAFADGYPLVIDGTNASDDASDRPGMKALAELNVRSPLRECGVTKDELRRLSKEAGLPTWNKPAYACLATRIPYGRPLTRDLLERVEGAESALFALGFSDFRVRVYHDAARLQFTPEQEKEALSKKTEVIKAIKPYFPIILLDLEGR